MPYIYAGLAAVSFAVLGITYKLSDRYHCDKQQVNFFMFFAGAIAMLLFGLLTHGLRLNSHAALFGLIMGALVYGSVVAFRHAASLGRISTSWTVANLALVVPVIASILFWREMPSPRHCIGLGLTLVAIILLGIDIGRARE